MDKAAFVALHVVMWRGLILMIACLALGTTASAADPTYVDVPIRVLTANPAAYDGRLVRVRGVFLHGEGGDLFASPQAYSRWVTQFDMTGGLPLSYAVGLSARLDERADMDRRYVHVSGRFQHALSGHIPVWPYGLVDVQAVELDPTTPGPVRLWGLEAATAWTWGLLMAALTLAAAAFSYMAQAMTSAEGTSALLMARLISPTPSRPSRR